jgi:hypothetical protein
VASDFLVDLKYLGNLGFWHLALELELSNIKVIYTTFRFISKNYGAWFEILIIL